MLMVYNNNNVYIKIFISIVISVLLILLLINVTYIPIFIIVTIHGC